MRPADLAELVRLPAALTVPGDAWAGAAWAVPTRRGWAVSGASTLLYWGGMALNDWCDRHLDAVERPERPLPSGRVTPRGAALSAGGLILGGVAGSALVGGVAALRVSIPLAGLICAYDAVAKNGSTGPFVMASTRVLDVALGAHSSPAAAWRPALAVGVHTVGVTALSRGEVHGTRPVVPGAACAATLAIAGATVLDTLRDRSMRPADKAAVTALATAYAAVVSRQQGRAVSDPSAERVREATRTGIAGLTLLQAAWLARKGRLGGAAVVASALPALRLTRRAVSTT